MSDAREPEIITHEREQLAYLLTEAAEIEHGLMCCYLYAAYSLKQQPAEGLTVEENAAVARWRSSIVEVAVDEMLHLSLVSNLLASIGSTPHFQRPNFPVAPGYHPAGVVVALAPFDRATLDHFIYLERPEGTDVGDGAGFEPPAPYQRAIRADRLVPSAQDYATVGHLYRGIRSGFTQLAERLGESTLFVGDPAAQVGQEIAPLEGLIAVTNLATALRAIDIIVEQGEGAPGHSERSHFSRFVRVRDELDALTRARPSFAPAHPAARNPVMRKPPEPRGKVHIEDPRSARVLDLGNAVYAFALRCLARAFGEADDPMTARARLVEASLTSMRELAPLMQRLASMPAGPSAAGTTAGLSFTMQRSTVGFSQQRAAWRILVERAREIAAAAATIARDVDPTASRTAETFAALSEALRAASPPGETAAGPTSPVAPAAQAQAVAPPITAAERHGGALGTAPAIEEARAPGAILRFEGKRCIHSRNCVLGAPDVFLANVKGPWLHPEAVRVQELVTVAESCPSGAITYERTDGGPQETAPKVNVVRTRENGPLAFHAAIELHGRGSMFRATLCRCGASQNKPFCDGSHAPASFAATGEPSTQPSEPLAQRSGTLAILPTPNGPLQVSGNLEICSGTGRTVTRVMAARLCRCGGSLKKPFCDGTHARIGFRSQ
jgi:CDGSH-type Zn-finger protein/uncharacterized Fe-S cluster protein YjdI